MGRTILIWGLVGGVIVAGLMQLSLLIFPNHDDASMWLGYLTMLIALSTIPIAIRQYRDQTGGGVITFWKGLAIGLGITVVAAVIYSAAWELYLAVSGRDFIGEYSAKMIERAQAEGAGAAKLAELRAQAAEWRAIYDNPQLRFGMTMVELLPVGVIVTLVSAFLMRFSGFLPAKAPLDAPA